MIANFVTMTGICITINLNFYTLIVGKLVMGLGIGLQKPCMLKMIEETVPNHLFTPLFILNIVFANSGNMISYFLGSVLPDNNDK